MHKRRKRIISGAPAPDVIAWQWVCLLALVLCAAVPAWSPAAQFTISSEGGASAPVGETSWFKIRIIPEKGEKITGGQCTLTVDPKYVELFEDRAYYASDPVFELVERFSVNKQEGIITFKAFAGRPILDEKTFVRIPFRMKKADSTYVSFTSFARYENGSTAPSNPGYFKVAGYDGLEMDPLLMAATAGENTLLTTGSLENKYRIQKARKQEPGAEPTSISMSMGYSALEKVEKEEEADVIVGFSKRQDTIGLNQWVRLDLVVYKFPPTETLDGMELVIDYDPSVLVYTDRLGQPADKVEVIKSVYDMSLSELKKEAEEYDIKVRENELSGEDKEKEELLEEYRRAVLTIRGSQVSSVLYDTEELGLGEGSNVVDRRKGRINLSLMNFSMNQNETARDLSDLDYPLTIVPLFFKGIKKSQNVRVSLKEVYLPVSDSAKQLLQDAYVTIDPGHSGCDKSLPPQLCAGDFEMTGRIAFNVIRKRELRKSYLSSLNKAADVSIAKYELTQNWNVFLDGSFKNGIRVDGTLMKRPGMPQDLDIELLGSDGGVHFGNFTSDFNGTSQITFNKEISGLDLNYDFGNFTFKALMAESRSQTSESTIEGNGTNSGYNGKPNMMPGSVQIYDPRTGEIIPADSYIVQYETGEITFKEPIRKGRVLNYRYEESTFSLSTGNWNAFGLSYASGRTDSGKDMFKVDTAYLISKAPSSSAKTIFVNSGVGYNLNGHEDVRTADCPGDDTDPNDENDDRCVQVNLGNLYIVEGSINVTKGGATYTPESNPDVVILGHRSLFSGRIYIRYDDGSENSEGLNGQVTIGYSYYNPNIIIEDVVQVLNFDSDDTTESNLPTNILPGSELIYLAETEDDTNLEEATIVCFEGKTGIRDDPDLCPGIHSYNMEDTGWDITYHIDDTGDRDYIEFSDDVRGNKYNLQKANYVIMSYYVTPPELNTGSKFTKTALGVDAKINVTDNLSFDVNYARTNSDLSSEYSSAEETILVDTKTTDRDDPTSGEACEYIADEAAGRKLVCGLKNDNISGQGKVLVTMQFCQRGKYICEIEDSNGNISEGVCENDKIDEAIRVELLDYNSVSDTFYNFGCVKDLTTGKYIYKEITHNINTRTHPEFVSVDRDQGNLIIHRETTGGISGGLDMFVVEFKEAFPTTGDKITVSYIYDEVLGEIVEGDTLVLKNQYRYKGFSMNLTKSITDPYYDSSMSGKAGNKGTNEFVGDFSLAFLDNWKLKYFTKNTQKESFSSGKLSSFAETFQKNYLLEYSSNKPVLGFKSITLKHDEIGNTGLNGINTSKTSAVDTEKIDKDYNFAMAFPKLSLGLTGGYGVTDESQNDTSTVEKKLSFNYNPSSKRNFSLSSDFTFTDISPSGSKTRHNVYKLNYKPIRYLTLNLNFDKTTSRDNYLADYEDDETNTYTADFADVWNLTGIKYKFTRNTNINKATPTRTDTSTFNFNWNIATGLKWTPSFTRQVKDGSSWNLQKSRSWKLSYIPPRTKMQWNMSWDRTYKEEASRNLTIDDSQVNNTTPQDSNTFTVEFKPAAKLRTTTSLMDQNGGTAPYRQYSINYTYTATVNTIFNGSYSIKNFADYPIKDFDLRYSYNYKPGFRIKANYNTKENGSTAGNDTLNYGLGFTYSVSQRTNFQLDFNRLITKYSTQARDPSENSNFTASLMSQL